MLRDLTQGNQIVHMTNNIFGELNSDQTQADSGISEIMLKAIETTNEMIIVTDAPEQIGDEDIVFVNKAFENVTQYSREEVLGKTPSFLQGPETDRDVIDDLVEKLSNGNRFEGETFNYKKDGTKYRVSWSIDPIRDEKDEITHFVAVQRDITDEWERRQKMQEIIEERETLVKETHHRIKNNLATITGLLELQIMKSNSESVREVLSESMNRVKSIASIHEKLYETEGLASITMDVYIKDLVEQVGESFDGIDNSGDVNFQLDLNPISLKTHQAVPLGLIINELVTNAQKHAFDDTGGTIAISCEEKGDNTVWLEVSDNGKGLPQDWDPQATDSLGVKLIETLSHQLEADYSFSSQDGTTFQMTFRKET